MDWTTIIEHLIDAILPSVAVLTVGYILDRGQKKIHIMLNSQLTTLVKQLTEAEKARVQAEIERQRALVVAEAALRAKQAGLL